MPKLTVELVPKSAHFSNARYILPKSVWNRVQRATAQAAGGSCEICGTQDRLECHELWSWEELSATQGVQRLVRTLALCRWCHRVKHWGHTEGMGYVRQARQHMLRVNYWTEAELEEHLRAAWREWARLSRLEWHLDWGSIQHMLPGR